MGGFQSKEQQTNIAKILPKKKKKETEGEGFGGNNATANVLSPQVVNTMLSKRYSTEEMTAYESRREQVRHKASAYDIAASQGNFDTIYHFGQDLIDENDIHMTDEEMHIPGFANPIDLKMKNRFKDMM